MRHSWLGNGILVAPKRVVQHHGDSINLLVCLQAAATIMPTDHLDRELLISPINISILMAIHIVKPTCQAS